MPVELGTPPTTPTPVKVLTAPIVAALLLGFYVALLLWLVVFFSVRLTAWLTCCGLWCAKWSMAAWGLEDKPGSFPRFGETRIF